MKRGIAFLCVFMLVIMVVPVLYGITPSPLSYRLRRIADHFDQMHMTFPEFPELDTEYINGASGLAKVLRTTIEFFRTLGQGFVWVFKVLWWFVKDIAIAIQALNIILFNAGG